MCVERGLQLWQRQGFESFGDWRRASERARKAAKKKAAAAAPAPVLAPTVVLVEQPTVRIAWQPLQQIESPSPHRVTSPHAALKLPGTLHEHVDVTPRGSRAHTLKHTSPGGTTRCEEYVSPAGPRQKLEERSAWRLQVAAARREERLARSRGRSRRGAAGSCDGDLQRPNRSRRTALRALVCAWQETWQLRSVRRVRRVTMRMRMLNCDIFLCFGGAAR
jgi:hypothetical protein